jgi:hypothetical protein
MPRKSPYTYTDFVSFLRSRNRMTPSWRDQRAYARHHFIQVTLADIGAHGAPRLLRWADLESYMHEEAARNHEPYHDKPQCIEGARKLWHEYLKQLPDPSL